MIVCLYHPEYQTPLIATFAFSHSEYWCPYCGTQTGMFDGGHNDVDATPELVARLEKYRETTREYLRAWAALTAYKLEYPIGSGDWVIPHELSDDIQDQLRQLRADGWRKHTRAE